MYQCYNFSSNNLVQVVILQTDIYEVIVLNMY